ncbi:MAG: hypothetical protein CSA11_07635 [Chloroflexi bacterium]|nr:MAG: hypothetical protein CSB13_02980 [Chloroflexota bacterium]PIE80463.1 MAG: hypothetical protein CSA11_07635 [Chloroflexota bacterium]
MQSVIVHVANEDPIVCEIENLPEPQDTLVLIHNPRRRDGMDLHYLNEDVNSVIFPLHRINFIQVLPTAEVSDIVGFVRE